MTPAPTGQPLGGGVEGTRGGQHPKGHEGLEEAWLVSPEGSLPVFQSEATCRSPCPSKESPPQAQLPAGEARIRAGATTRRRGEGQHMLVENPNSFGLKREAGCFARFFIAYMLIKTPKFLWRCSPTEAGEDMSNARTQLFQRSAQASQRSLGPTRTYKEKIQRILNPRAVFMHLAVCKYARCVSSR